MEKGLKIVKTIAVVLIVALVSAIAFGGLYIYKQGVWTNVLPEFNLGMELGGIREVHFTLDTSEEEKEIYLDSNGNYAGDVTNNVDTNTTSSDSTSVDLVDEDGNPINTTTDESTEATENVEATEATTESTDATAENTESTESTSEDSDKDTTLDGYTTETRTVKVNDDSVVNIDNFEKAKKIIQNRLEKLSLYEYNIRLDNVSGDLVVEMPDDDNVTTEESLITTAGKFEMIDYQNGLILLDNSDLKSATANYYTTSDSQYQVYLIIELNKDGQEKLKEISKKYVSTTDDAGTETIKYVTIELDDQQILQTYFGEELTNGTLQISLGSAGATYDDIKDTLESAQRVAQILNSEKLPLIYKVSSDNYITSSITKDDRTVAVIAFAVVVAIVSIVMIIKFKLKGLKYAVLNVGYIAILSLISRYTNVIITFNSVIAFLIAVAINLSFDFMYLSKAKKSDDAKTAFVSSLKELYLAIIPICVIAVIFTFVSGTVISSIGMVLFWGLALQAICSGLLYLLGII